jgi:L,D-transpeptidase YcbB
VRNAPSHVLSVLCLAVFVALGCSLSTPPAQQAPSSAADSAAQALSAAGQQRLHSLLDKGRLDGMQWPDLSDHIAAVRKFYDRAAYKLEWTRGGKPTPQATQLIALFEQAGDKGLDPVDYDSTHWPARVGGLNATSAASEDALVDFDLALTASGMRYATDLHLGKVDPGTLHTDFEPERDAYDLCDFLLEHVATSPNVPDTFTKIEPPFPGYHRAMLALHDYRQLAASEKLEPLPTVTKPIAPGQPYAAVPQLLHRLQFLGDLSATASVSSDPGIYQGDVVQGVKAFQVRHGLDAAGKLGPDTIAQLNVPMSQRVSQLELTLERWRWLPHNFDEPPIAVNIPEFQLRAYKPGGLIDITMPVVVGRAMRTQTPVMEEEMKYLIFWPYWNVPPSIQRSEIVPKIAKDPGYLQKEQLEVTTYSGEVVTDSTVSPEVLAQLRAGKLAVRQKPGPKNALGLIKFIFPNNNNVYLHSTPSQNLFSESRRDFSHGCVRVEDPQKLATWVLRNNPGWTADRVAAAFKAQKQEQVNLTKPIPVLIVYATAVVPEEGRAHFYEDIYGHDKTLGALFTQAYAARK